MKRVQSSKSHYLRSGCAALVLALGTMAGVAQAQGAPNPAGSAAGNARPVTLLVPTSSGTGADIVARLFGPKLAVRLNRPVVVENRTGASGSIGFAAAAKAVPDGSTVLVSPSSLTVLPHLSKSVTWDPFTDFAPVALIAGNVLAAIVNPNVPANTMAELTALARAQPGKLNFATPGVGTPHHLVAEMYKQAAGVNLVHIPYKTSAAAVTDMAGGQVEIGFFPLHGVLPLVKVGKLRVLATLAEQRTPWSPEVPTMREAGLESVFYNSWTAVFLPRGAAPELVRGMSQHWLGILNEPGMNDALLKDGLLASPMNPEQLTAMMKRDTAVWAQVIRNAGITPE